MGAEESTQPRAERYGHRLEANHAVVEIGKVIGWQGNNGADTHAPADADTDATSSDPFSGSTLRSSRIRIAGVLILLADRKCKKSK